MAGVLTAFPTLLASTRSAYLKGVMLDEMRKAVHSWQRFYNQSNMDGQWEVYTRLAGMGMLQEIPVEIPDQWPQDDPIQSYSKTYTVSWYGLGTTLSKKFMKYDRDGLQGYMKGRGLIRSAHNHQEYYAASVFNNLTSTATAYVLPDAKAVGATNHPLIDNLLGGLTTYSNYSNASPDHDTLVAALLAMQLTPDERGIPIVVTPKHIFCHPSLVATFKELIGSDLRSDTSENATNTLKNVITVEPWRWLTAGTGVWGIQATEHEVNWKWGQGVEIEVWRDPSNKSVHADVDQMFGFGVGDWRGLHVGNEA